MSATLLKEEKYPIKLTIRILTKLDRDSEYIAYCPEYKSVLAGGKTEKEAVENFKTAFKSHIETLIKFHKSISCILENVKDKKQHIEDVEININSNASSLSFT